MLRRILIAFGVVSMLFGGFLVGHAHSTPNGCATLHAVGTTSSGLGATCVHTLIGYSEGFVFMAAGLIVTVIAVTMISRRERLNLRSELRAVPRTWKKADYVITSECDENGVVNATQRVVYSSRG